MLKVPVPNSRSHHFLGKRLDTTGIREYIIPLHQEWHQNDACQPRSSTHGESLSIGLRDVEFNRALVLPVACPVVDRQAQRYGCAVDGIERVLCRTPKDLTAFPPDKAPVKTGQGFGAEV